MIYRNSSFEEYAKIPGLSSHGAGVLQDCPKKYGITSDLIRDCFVRGTALHAAATEQERFAALYLEPPHGNYTKLAKNGGAKEAWDDYKVKCTIEDRPILTDTQWDEVVGMRAAIWKHAEAASILGDAAHTELSLTFAVDGVPCKTRVDLVTRTNARADIKTAASAKPDDIAKRLDDFGYARQAAFNERGLAENGIVSPVHYLIVVESAAPHVVEVYPLDAGALDFGRWEMSRAIDLYARCTMSGKWPGYNFDWNTLEPLPRTVGMSKWAWRRKALIDSGGLGFIEADIPF